MNKLGYLGSTKLWTNQASYSGCDIIPIIHGIDATTKEPKVFVLGDIQTLTYSIHRDKGPVRTLGRVNPKSFVRGPRLCAGTMIFSVFDRRALWEISKNRNKRHRVAIADSLPGFDVILYFTNEYGYESTLMLYNIQVVDEGQSHSVNDMYIENTMSFVCQELDLLEPKGTSLPSSAIFLGSENKSQRIYTREGIRFDYTYFPSK